MNQDIFDNLISLCLDTIPSKEYLKDHVGIFVSDVLYKSKLKKFIEDYNRNPTKISPGLYPILDDPNLDDNETKEVLEQSVHYYGVNSNHQIANGYLDGFDFFDGKILRGLNLDAQEDGSHGFCQTIALMFYHNEHHKLNLSQDPYNEDEDSKEIRYKQNVKICLDWLINFTKKYDKKYDFEFPVNKDIFLPESIKFLHTYKTIKKSVTLNRLLQIVNLKKHESFLYNWFDEEDEEE